ncbi:MAG TPA: carboxypeptidase-like regulatory domain-containing protein [Bryobacteraceae bacterium]|nr:carboxypeptidase-like regulatory domain-containing protein [Bryobacteraceae bacterium]
MLRLNQGVILAACLAVAAFAQVTTTGIHGVVRDPSGATVPIASLRLRDIATGIEKTGTANAEGTFVFVNLVAGTYSLTASAPGFQTAKLDNIVVDTGRTTDLSVSMSVGATTDTIEVTGTAAQLETTSNEVGTTINNKSIQNLPYASRDSLQFALLMPGNSSANDATGRNSTYNGLPNASMNITIDGMNNNSQRFKSGGTSFYAFAPARIDAMEEVTVSTTGLGADASGEGAMAIRFTTKRGTDQYHFAVGEQFANEDLNANTFFKNLRGQPISKTRQNNPYGSIGGPLLPFIPAMKHKLFFFAYFEAQPQPTSITENTTVLTSAAQAGNFTYLGTDGTTRTVNLLTSAQAAGLPGAVDPTVAGILGAINSSQQKATGFLSVTGQPYFQNMLWTQPENTLYLFPTARVDYQIAPKVAWHGTWNLRYENIAGGANYPGMSQYNYGGGYKITTYVGTNSVDWTITPHMLNNFTFGVQSNGEYFYQGSAPQQWNIYGNRNIVFPAMTLNTGTQYVSNASATATALSPVVVNQTPFIRNNPVYQLNDTLSWVKGRHNISIGGTLLHTSFYETSYGSAGVPSYNLGLPSSDPALTAITNALPFINTQNGDLGNAQALYALLTGRLSSISGSTNVDENSHQYNQFAPVTQRYAFTTGGVFIQDNLRITSNLTVNFGFRWQFDGTIHNTNGIDSEPVGQNFFGPSNGLFQPGVLNGNLNPALTLVKSPYSADLVNPAPNVGFAWNPSGTSGLAGKILGNHKTVIRGAYSVTYYNEGLNAVSNVLSSNQGTTQSISAVPGGAGFPISGLNLGSAQPALAVFPSSFSFPLPESYFTFSGGNTLYYINPNQVSPYVQNWNVGVQRELPSHVVLEVRYIGNKSTHMWHYQNVNEVNIFENGFLPQFNQAYKNLTINQANGKGNTFVNNGLAGQGAIPIFETAFGANGSQAALSASQGFGNSTFITDLNQGLAGTLANSLASTASSTYYCRLVGANFAPCGALGFTAATPYPINFFSPNPFATTLRYQDDNGNNSYNGLQLDVRKQASHGLFADFNFNWSHALGTELNNTGQAGDYQWFTLRNGRLSYGPSPFDRRMVMNAYWTYDLPIGKDRALNIRNPILDRIFGGWTVGGIESIGTGAPNILNGGRNTVNNLAQSGVVLGSGLTPTQLQKDLATIPNMNQVVSGNLISNVASIAQSNGAANPAYYGPAATPGAFSALVYQYARTSLSLDMSLNKEVRVKEHLRVGFRMEALNFLNHPFFALGSNSPTATSFGQVSSTMNGNAGGSFGRSVLLRAYVAW